MTTGARPDLLVLHKIFQPTLTALESAYTVHKLWLAEDRDATLKLLAPRVRGLVTTGLGDRPSTSRRCSSPAAPD